MKNLSFFSLLFVLFVGSSSFASFTYGFLNQDINGYTLQYSGPHPRMWLSEDQRQTMLDCTEEKTNGYNAMIRVEAIPDEQIHSDGVTTHLPKFKVDCIYPQDFEELLNTWRKVVGNSSFRRCL